MSKLSWPTLPDSSTRKTKSSPQSTKNIFINVNFQRSIYDVIEKNLIFAFLAYYM